jgi:two-component sensor histidine kinase
MEQAIPLGLIVNELVNNTIKYAFPNSKEGNIYISFKKEDKHCILTCKDDGIGLPDDLDLDNLTGLGLIVVQNLTFQIGGNMSIIDCKGTGFKIEFDQE